MDLVRIVSIRCRRIACKAEQSQIFIEGLGLFFCRKLEERSSKRDDSSSFVLLTSTIKKELDFSEQLFPK